MLKADGSVDLSIPRRKYFMERSEMTNCPECGAELKGQSSAVLISVVSELDEGTFVTNNNDSHFCTACPVVAYNMDPLLASVRTSVAGAEKETTRFMLHGVVNFDEYPEEDLEEDDDLPVVEFLPDLSSQPRSAEDKVGRNDPCPCGSGKKYKKCCG
ncbi:SEC-C metal-binding domain-containing protein [Persicobacter psychrovividus]|uniref:Zinc chelation protein SecC n=1 Tax=Persicobacter psychrovividus TaxID=387638 RepID=A0ABM7VD44_9BACT|nr:hypothetical protein PEPS_11510 [Persicobacter psychrovividus]